MRKIQFGNKKYANWKWVMRNIQFGNEKYANWKLVMRNFQIGSRKWLKSVIDMAPLGHRTRLCTCQVVCVDLCITLGHSDRMLSTHLSVDVHISSGTLSVSMMAGPSLIRAPHNYSGLLLLDFRHGSFIKSYISAVNDFHLFKIMEMVARLVNIIAQHFLALE